MDELVRSVTIEYYRNGKLDLTEKRSYRTSFNFNQDSARKISQKNSYVDTIRVIRAKSAAFIFLPLNSANI